MTDFGIGVFSDASECSDHPLSWKPEDVSEIIAEAQWCYCHSDDAEAKHCGSYCDSDGVGVYRLKNGNILTLHESSDTSGHG